MSRDGTLQAAVGNLPRMLAQRRAIEAAFGSACQLQENVLPNELPNDVAPANRTGMPDQLKAGIESLSGMDLSGVRVHRNWPGV